MAQEPSGISSDLQWILGSGQADKAMLAEALVNEHYLHLCRLALAMLGNIRSAHQAAMQTISGAMRDLPRRQGSVQIYLWLYGHAIRRINRLEAGKHVHSDTEAVSEPTGVGKDVEAGNRVCKVFESFGRKERYALALYYLLEWDVGDIAVLLRVNRHAVQIQLDLSREQFSQALGSILDPEPMIPTELSVEQINIRQQEYLDAHITKLLQAHWPAPQIKQDEWDRILEQIKSHEAEKSARWYSSIGWRELRLVFGAILLIAFMGLGAILLLDVEPLSGLGNISSVSATPAPTPVPAFPPDAEGQIYLYAVQPGDTLESIAWDLNLPQERLSEWNDVISGTMLIPGQELQVIPYAAYFPPPTPIPQAPSADRLKPRDDSEVIFQRITTSQNLWHTVWIDTQSVDYGPAGYIGGPRIYHAQAWIDQPAQSLELFGLLGDEPSNVSLVADGKQFLLTPEVNAPTVSTWDENKSSLLRNKRLRHMVFPHKAPWGNPDGQFETIGTDEIAARETLIVDWYNRTGDRQARLWLDTTTGLTLRQQEFSGPNFGTLVSDSVATAIIYNLEIPGESLFDPHALLLQDYATLLEEDATPDQLQRASPAIPLITRPRLPVDPAANDFDPALSQLHFQFPEVSAQYSVLGSTPVDSPELFADGYAIGHIMIYPPWGLQCSRSPDGQHLVYNKLSDGVSPPDASLRWIKLSDPESVYEPLPGFEAQSFAFAPDSRHLAVFGVDQQGSDHGIHIVDLGTGESWPLTRIYHADSLEWSPDGAYLAFVGQKADTPGTHIMIIHVRLGEVIFERPVQLTGTTQEFLWSSMAWRLEFPEPMGDMGDCAKPPGQ